MDFKVLGRCIAEVEARRGKFESGHRDACQASLLYCGTGAPLTLGRGRVHAIFVACVPSAQRARVVRRQSPGSLPSRGASSPRPLHDLTLAVSNAREPGRSTL